MLIRVRKVDSESTSEYDINPAEQTVHDLKEIIRTKEGFPEPFVHLYFSDGKEVRDDNTLLSDAGFTDDLNDPIYMAVCLNGGGGPGIKFDRFEFKTRTMCCYAGIDGDWDKCQYFCIKCECSIM
eukprot:Colp12_sorted_trinity150504_noHs@26750